jgi:hypothetical protein
VLLFFSLTLKKPQSVREAGRHLCNPPMTVMYRVLEGKRPGTLTSAQEVMEGRKPSKAASRRPAGSWPGEPDGQAPGQRGHKYGACGVHMNTRCARTERIRLAHVWSVGRGKY